jgi:hypothetical protein
MKRGLALLLLLSVLVAAAALYADGRFVRLSKDGEAKQPKWLEIEVTRDSGDIIVVVLRIQERVRVSDYSLMLQTKSGQHKGLLVPVAVTRVRNGHTAIVRLPRELAAVATLTLSEVLKNATGGNTYEIDIASYMGEEEGNG